GVRGTLTRKQLPGPSWLEASMQPFFFSSRRRHTRSKRDWSSDVCSSDLIAISTTLVYQLPVIGIYGIAVQLLNIRRITDGFTSRSEERRVGKEWRTRWQGSS